MWLCPQLNAIACVMTNKWCWWASWLIKYTSLMLQQLGSHLRSPPLHLGYKHINCAMGPWPNKLIWWVGTWLAFGKWQHHGGGGGGDNSLKGNCDEWIIHWNHHGGKCEIVRSYYIYIICVIVIEGMCSASWKRVHYKTHTSNLLINPK